MRGRTIPAALILLALGLVVARAEAAPCPFTAPPLQCKDFSTPLDASVRGPSTAGGVEVLYLYLPLCSHCAELEPVFSAWASRLPPEAKVRRQLVVWSMPANLTMYDARVADAMLDALDAPTSATREFIELAKRGWHRQDAETFFTRLGMAPADADEFARSERTVTALQRRVELARIVPVEQVPYVIVAGRSGVTVAHDAEGWQPERFVNVLSQLLVAAGVQVPPSAVPPSRSSDAAGARPIASKAMPLPPDFLPAPPNAATMPPRRCSSGDVRTEPTDLRRKDPMAERMLSQLRLWGERHFRFEGCTDYGFIISQWQAMVGLPQTGVLDAAVVGSVRDEVMKIQPQLLAAQKAWTEANPSSSTPAARLPAALTGRAAPVGAPEQQVFGFSLGQPLASQLQVCAWRSGLFGGLDFSRTCQYRLTRLGTSSKNWLTSLEAEIFSESVADAAAAVPEADGLVAISFSDEDRPGILARAGIRGLLVEGRLEGVGFVPSDRDAVLSAFSSRFGAPVPVPVSMQNESGATWVGQRYEFRRNDVTATLNCVEFGSTGCSFAEVLTTRGRAALQEWSDRDARRGVQF